MLIPANILPIIFTQNAGKVRTDTVFTGIIGLCEHGWWILAAIVFIASILIPILKLLGLAVLVWWIAHQGPNPQARPLTRLYVVLHFIGRWSMLDVFLVAFISGVVQFGLFANAEPRSGLAAFAAAVVLTMLATAAFDPRALWDRPLPPAPPPPSA